MRKAIHLATTLVEVRQLLYDVFNLTVNIPLVPVSIPELCKFLKFRTIQLQISNASFKKLLQIFPEVNLYKNLGNVKMGVGEWRLVNNTLVPPLPLF
jgi:hypothetical protein